MDEAYIGTTPFAIYQPSGTHKLRLTLDGYNDNEISDVIITIGKTTTVKVALTKSSSPSSTTGSLQITSIPHGAAVYIDGGSQGTTPTTINGLTAGSHTMKLTKSGYTDYQQPALTITAGKTLSLNVNLVAGTGSTSPTQTPTPYQTGTTGSLSIISSPSGASVNLDGLDKGTTPVTLDQVKAGSHTLTLTKSGYQDSVKTVTVTGGSTTQVTITLTSQDPNPSPSGLSTLTVRSTPSGANVYVDGEKMGTTPVQIQNVKAGTHKLLLTLQGYSDISQTADITSGSDKEVSVDFGKKAPGFGVPVSLAALALVSLVLLGRRKER